MKIPTLSLIHNRRNDGKGRLEVKVYFPDVKKQLYISLGYNVEDQYFDKELNLISPDAPNYISLKKIIKLTFHEIKDVLASLQEGRTLPLAPEDFTYAYKRRKKKVKEAGSTDFLAFYQDELNKATELSKNTKTSYESTLRLLTQYRALIGFNQLDYEFAIGFDRWLRRKYSNLNTIKKHNLVLRRFVSMAHKLSFVTFETYNNFTLFSSTGQAVNKDYLLPEEINEIEALKCTVGTKEYDVQQMFLFAYYTALRISDILDLRKSNFTVIQGNMFLKKIIYKLRKYNREISMNITTTFEGKGQKIAKEYLKKESDFLFEGYTASSTYPILKALIARTGIDKVVSFHTARHSSLTTIAAISGNVFTVMVHGGLTNIRTAQNYIHLSEGMFEKK